MTDKTNTRVPAVTHISELSPFVADVLRSFSEEAPATMRTFPNGSHALSEMGLVDLDAATLTPAGAAVLTTGEAPAPPVEPPPADGLEPVMLDGVRWEREQAAGWTRESCEEPECGSDPHWFPPTASRVVTTTAVCAREVGCEVEHQLEAGTVGAVVDVVAVFHQALVDVGEGRLVWIDPERLAPCPVPVEG